ncbi:TolC family outer membrane protein [Methylotenera sp. 1P/1]|uniref:TolC family outer membrane protein n=1 Tax=Methylotenera sp. 1P/1 TaxID=1131551 RepID=UPI00036DBF57|nr:TolC family outer membrane protein [Methylotenera sp. 1P/1]
MWRISVMVLLWCIGQQAWAEEDLNSLYQKAVEHNADYRAALVNTEADREELNKAKALFYPKVQMALSRGRGITDRTTQTAIGAIETNLDYRLENYGLTVRQPIFNKETWAIYGGAKSFVSAQESLLRQENAKLILKLTSTYLEILYARAKVNLLNAKVAAVSQQLRQAEKRYTQGSGTVVEINEAQTNLDIANVETIQAGNDLNEHLNTLQILTGETSPLSAELMVSKLPISLPKEENIAYWLEMAIQHNPEISAATHTLEVAKQELEKRRAGHYPTLDLVGARSYSENDSNNTLGSRFDTTTVALQMNVPLFAGGYVSANVRQAANKLTAAEESLTAKTREVEYQVRKYYNSVETQFQTINAYQQAVKSSRVAMEGTQKGFITGFKTNIEVLDAQQKLFSNQLELTKSQYSLINDLVNLKFSSGLLNQGELTKISAMFITTTPRNQHETQASIQ